IWLCGALIAGDIQLFDARLGAQLPGPNGQSIATLAQARTQAVIVQQLKPYQYDVTPEQARQAAVHVGCSLSALAPRMQQLQTQLAAFSNVRLSQDLAANARTLQQSEQALAGASVRIGGSSSPMRVLRGYLPPEEGGGDRSREKQRRFNGTLIPWL